MRQATVHEGYRIQVENGLHLPQRFSQVANGWVYYTEMKYGRKVNVSYKTEAGAVNFLDIEWFKNLNFEAKGVAWKSGNISEAIRKAVKR